MLRDRDFKDTYRILQVEDNPGDARLVQLYAEEDPYAEVEFELAESLADAQTKLSEDPFDLVLLDLNLPDSQGLETLIELMDRDYELPVIVLTGMDDHQAAVRAVRVGAQDYLIKGPSLEGMLMRAIRYAMERHHLYMVQRELALRDELTKLYNRRGLRMLAEQQFRLAERRGEYFSVLLADIDDMKSINDEHGHPAGDDALRDMARVMQLTFRTSDVLARVGGDEFVVLALDTQPEDEEVLTGRWQQTLAEYMQESRRPYSLSISIGVYTSSPSEHIRLDDMIRRADESMYQDKQNDGSVAERAAGR